MKKKTIKDVKENYCKPIRVNDFCSSNYIEYESKVDKIKILLVEEYLSKIRPY